MLDQSRTGSRFSALEAAKLLLHLEILRLRRRRLQLHLGSSCDGLDPAVLVVSRMVGVMEQAKRQVKLNLQCLDLYPH